MPVKKQRFFSLFSGVLFVLALLQAGPFQQVRRDEIAKKYPEIEGVYEFQLGQRTRIIQFYFKDGALRHVATGNTESTKWDPVPESALKFTTVHPEQGTYQLEFLKDERGRYTKFRLTNEEAKIEIIGTKTGELDDANADPASPEDRLGYFERHYRKSERRVPMRDGVRLFTQVYSPIAQSERHPILLHRNAYGIPPYGETFTNMTLPSLYFLKENYILVFQDIRGTAMSEGEFEDIRPYIKNKKTTSDVDESSDAYDTVEWLLNNIPDHNGKVGAWGISYSGFTAAMAAISAHPAVLAVSPQAPPGDLFLGDDNLHNGALHLAHYAYFIYYVGQPRKAPTPDPPPRLRFPTPDGYSFWLQLGPLKNITAKVMGSKNRPWNETMAHETYDDYWKAHSMYPHLRDIKPAVLTVGGWYDAENLYGALGTYKTIEKLNPGLQNTLVMGPWTHGRWNLLSDGSEDLGVFPFSGTRAYFQEKIELPFFNYYLKGKGPLNLPEAIVFETGTDQWRSYNTWPPAEATEKTLFFGNSGRLSFEPTPDSPRAGFDEYVSDPAKPVPYTMQIYSMQNSIGYYRQYFVEDQRFAASRPDVLVYTSEPLAQNMTIAGPIKAELYVSTTGTDADWVVKVIDVYPDDAPDPRDNPANIRMGGYQRMVRGEIFRGKFRNSFEKPEPFVPGEVTKVAFELPDVEHAFLKGHRIMIQVQSSWFPLFDRNPQKFCNIREAGEEDFRKATHRVYHTSRYPSGITLRVLPK
jgi:putative CocE/NonD family hydrolase